MISVVGEMGMVEVQAFVLFKVNSGMEKEVSVNNSQNWKRSKRQV
jgi:hypothetical protein